MVSYEDAANVLPWLTKNELRPIIDRLNGEEKPLEESQENILTVAEEIIEEC